MTALNVLRTEVQTKVDRVAALLKEMGPDLDPDQITSLSGTADEKLAEWQRLNREANEIASAYQKRVELDTQAKGLVNLHETYSNPAPGAGMTFSNGGGAEQKAPRDLLQLMRDNKDLGWFAKSGHKGSIVLAELSAAEVKGLLSPGPTSAETKTLLTLTTLAPVTQRMPGILPFAQEQRTVRDLLGSGTITGPVSYVVETTFTNAAAETTEGNAKPESALAFTETTANPAVIATWIPATRQILDDLPYMESYLRQRLPFMVKRREETELLTGDGNAPNIRGLLNVSGVQTQAAGTDNNFDAIYKGIVKVRNTGFAEPTALVIHPNNMQTIVLTKTSTGEYLYGSPADPDLSQRLWGLEVRETSAETANTALVGNFRTDAAVLEREGMTIMVSTEHSTYFVENKVAILAEERLALAVYRPASFCKVTGLA